MDTIVNEWFTGKLLITAREEIWKSLHPFRFHLLGCRRVKCNKGWIKLSVGERLSVLHDFGFKQCSCMKARKIRRKWKGEGASQFCRICHRHPWFTHAKIKSSKNRINCQGNYTWDYFIWPWGKIWRPVFDLGWWTKSVLWSPPNRIPITLIIKGPFLYLLRPLLRKNEISVTQHMYAHIGPNLDNIHWGRAWFSLWRQRTTPMSRDQKQKNVFLLKDLLFSVVHNFLYHTIS